MAFQSVDLLEDALSRPSEAAVAAMGSLDGDLIVLGAGGKMGPTLTRMARRASDAAGVERKVIAVSRFSDVTSQAKLGSWGVETICGDLMDREFLLALPDCPNVVFMAGMKFGSTGNEGLTWAMNVHLPALVAERFAGSRIAAFSTGNVYGHAPVTGSGSLEGDKLQPRGEYAMSCLGRERVFEYFCSLHGTRVAIVRLNYATGMRYGLLVDLAAKIVLEQPIDLRMGYANVIWQGDANAAALCALADASSPPFVVNIAGEEIFRVREVVEQLAARMGMRVEFSGTEANDALLSNGGEGHRRYGSPSVSLETMIDWTAEWVSRGGESLGKPTHFESRDGKF